MIGMKQLGFASAPLEIIGNVVDTRGYRVKYTKSVVLLMIVLSTGCATNRSQSDSAAPPTLPGEVVAANAPPPPPLNVPSASRKRLVLNMTGPAAVTQAKDWPAFQEEWRSTFADHAKEAGVSFEVQKGDAHSIGEAGTLLHVYVNDYRMIGIGARIMLGVMTGNAYIDAKADYMDLNDATVFGERSYNTKSSAWGGVFAKMTPQQVDAIASRVFSDWASGTSK
jgi:hypothetical protein